MRDSIDCLCEAIGQLTAQPPDPLHAGACLRDARRLHEQEKADRGHARSDARSEGGAGVAPLDTAGKPGDVTTRSPEREAIYRKIDGYKLPADATTRGSLLTHLERAERAYWHCADRDERDRLLQLVSLAIAALEAVEKEGK